MFSSRSTRSTSRSSYSRANFSPSVPPSADSVSGACSNPVGVLKITLLHPAHPSPAVIPNNSRLCSPRAKNRKRESIQTPHFQAVTNAYSHNPRIFILLQTGGGGFFSKPAKHLDRSSAYTNETLQTLSSHVRTHSFVHNGGRGIVSPRYLVTSLRLYFASPSRHTWHQILCAAQTAGLLRRRIPSVADSTPSRVQRNGPPIYSPLHSPALAIYSDIQYPPRGHRTKRNGGMG
jgi:hypothetical protein